MHKEFTLCFPRYELLDIEDDSINPFIKLLNILEIEIDLNWLFEQLDEYIIGEGSIYVFHNPKDIDSFLLLDCFCGYTDQLNTTLIQVRVREDKSVATKTALEELRQSYWDKNDCLVRENYNDEVKTKSLTYENFIIENERKESIAWRQHLESLNRDGLTFRFIGKEENKEFKVHQTIFHYLGSKIIEL